MWTWNMTISQSCSGWSTWGRRGRAGGWGAPCHWGRWTTTWWGWRYRGRRGRRRGSCPGWTLMRGRHRWRTGPAMEAWCLWSNKDQQNYGYLGVGTEIEGAVLTVVSPGKWLITRAHNQHTTQPPAHHLPTTTRHLNNATNIPPPTHHNYWSTSTPVTTTTRMFHDEPFDHI